MKLDLRPLLSGEKFLPIDYELDIGEYANSSSGYLYGVSFPSPMKVSGDITNTAGYMYMTLTLSVDYSAACARCLEPVSGSFTLDLQKTIATKDIVEDLPEEKLDDYFVIEDGFLDMDDSLIDYLEMEFPAKLLCKDDCRGLCQGCGQNLNKTDCSCKGRDIDPRMAPLLSLLDSMNDQDD